MNDEHDNAQDDKAILKKLTEPRIISSGTLRAADLIPAFMQALDDRKEEISVARDFTLEAAKNAVRRIDDFLAQIEQRRIAAGEEWIYYESEEADHDLEELQEMLDEYAPHGFYFGTSEGDGACFGFWFVENEENENDRDEFDEDY